MSSVFYSMWLNSLMTFGSRMIGHVARIFIVPRLTSFLMNSFLNPNACSKGKYSLSYNRETWLEQIFCWKHYLKWKYKPNGVHSRNVAVQVFSTAVS
jgi:hypothetical protein